MKTIIERKKRFGLDVHDNYTIYRQNEEGEKEPIGTLHYRYKTDILLFTPAITSGYFDYEEMSEVWEFMNEVLPIYRKQADDLQAKRVRKEDQPDPTTKLDAVLKELDEEKE